MPSNTYISVLFLVFVLVSENIYGNSCDPEQNLESLDAEQIRVALRGPNTVSIAWRTTSLYNSSSPEGRPRVQYHTTDAIHKGSIVSGSSATYTTNGAISYFHEVLLTVNSSTTYWYRVLKTYEEEPTPKYSFTSQVAAGDSRQINITIIGDVGYFNLGANGRIFDQIVNGLLSMSQITNFYLHLGDLSYADDIPEISSYPFYETTWNLFQNKMEAITASKMYMTVPGNHEATCMQLYDCLCERNDYTNNTQQYRNFSAYLHRFSMPGGDSDMTYKNMWYSFDYGMAHFVIINTETDFPGAPSGPNTSLNAGNFAPDGTQLTWLAADLKDARNRSCEVPWIIVAGHRPWYGSVPSYPDFAIQSDNCPTCREAFAEILFENKVDLYYSGHVHWYERLYPVNRNGTSSRKNYTEPEGPIYITTGAGGAPEGAQSTTSRVDASAVLYSTYGFSRLEIISPSRAELYFYNVSSSNPEAIDHQTVIRSDPCKKTCSS